RRRGDGIGRRCDRNRGVRPGLIVRESGHSGTHYLAVRRHDLHAAVATEVIAILTVGVADAVIECIADETAPARIRAVDPDLQPAILDMAVEIVIRDSGLDDARASPLVHAAVVVIPRPIPANRPGAGSATLTRTTPAAPPPHPVLQPRGTHSARCRKRAARCCSSRTCSE